MSGSLPLNRNINNLLYTFCATLFISCGAISTENPCDPSSDTFLNTQLLKFLVNDTSSTCGGGAVENSCNVFKNGEAATIVLGQADFTDNSSFGTAPNQFRGVAGAVMDSQGGLWIADAYNSPADSRILHFPSPIQTNADADIILTANPLEARLIAMDLSGGLWVVAGTTGTGNKVVHYAPGMISGDSPDMMLGTGGSASGPNQLNNPYGVAVDPTDGGVWVADYFNNRVMHYQAPITNSMPADKALGVSGLSGAGSGPPSNTTINRPTGVAVDPAGNLWVAEYGNNRVLRFSPPFSTGMQANMVLGQPNFGTSGSGSGRFGLAGPNAVSIDSSGAVWVADTGNGRAVRFSPPFSSLGKGADAVLGKPDFNAGFNSAATAENAGGVVSVAAAPCGLWVMDSNNRRALFFP
ncbi:hypothetical protein CH365_17735 [Leptospira neocaledonica]|uniref:SMP-30/Gluconolactonase/LRE-like region domain-containing protein n=1 Tax=Leptospira neocaledonica TaxID=2023192 RepID=A0A2M9ZUD0_9LEPT|nr:hypothetical protein CH365_17735 [Leptospira neocaledonica]